MKAIVTGMNGTVAPVLGNILRARGISVIPWNRATTPIDDPVRVESFIVEQQPEWFFHIGMGSPLWAQGIAETCRDRGIKMLFTSSVSVFSESAKGPFAPDTVPDGQDDYARYKVECEQRVRAANADAIIARLGWQIGERPGSNNMVDYLYRTMTEKGQVEASATWLVSCAFIQDTADALYRLMRDHDGGLYHLEGNPGWTFHEVVSALNDAHGRSWNIVSVEGPPRDNRMVDDRIRVRPIQERLPPQFQRLEK
jgi:dTDP-4-dehydrorhamnose reductase